MKMALPSGHFFRRRVHYTCSPLQRGSLEVLHDKIGAQMTEIWPNMAEKHKNGKCAT